MKRILVTGGKGFIGRHLVNYLKNKGHWVRSVDTHETGYPPTNEDQYLELDLRCPEQALLAVDGVDWVINLAANVGGIGYIMKYHIPIMRDNVRINVNILEASRIEYVERFFFSSSACVYPIDLQESTTSAPLKEDFTGSNPDSAYGWEKLFMEQLCKYYHEDYLLPVRIARFHNVYGPHIRPEIREKAPISICRKIFNAKDGGSITVWGDGEQTRSFLYVTDCVEAIHRLTESNYYKPMNVGTDEAVSINDLAKLIMKIANKTLTIKHDLSQPQGVRGRNADLTLIKGKLGWKPKVSLEEGMTKMYRWIEQRGGK